MRGKTIGDYDVGPPSSGQGSLFQIRTNRTRHSCNQSRGRVTNLKTRGKSKDHVFNSTREREKKKMEK